MSDNFTLVEKALVTALSGNASLVAMVGTNIFDSQAPDGTTGDYVVFQHIVGGDTVDSPRQVIDVQYRVEMISQTQNNARTGAGYIHDALHNADISAGITGWNCFRSRMYRLFNQVENHDGREWYRKGGFFRLQFSKNSVP